MNHVDAIIQESKASQDKQELNWVYNRVSKISPEVIVEIGSWKGDLLDTFDKLFAPEILIGVENDVSVVTRENAEKFKIVYGDSERAETYDAVVELLKTRPIDYLFIDADHHYQAVKNDFEIYSQLVRPGGIIGFHDIALEGLNADGHSWWDLGLQVKKFWDEIRVNYKHEQFRGNGLATGTGLLYIDERSEKQQSTGLL